MWIRNVHIEKQGAIALAPGEELSNALVDRVRRLVGVLSLRRLAALVEVLEALGKTEVLAHCRVGDERRSFVTSTFQSLG